MKKQYNILLNTILCSVLLGLSTWLLYNVAELKTLVGMLQVEILQFDKQIGRIYSHMDRLMNH